MIKNKKDKDYLNIWQNKYLPKEVLELKERCKHADVFRLYYKTDLTPTAGTVNLN